MVQQVNREFGEKFLTSVDNFYEYGVHLLFNEWWESAPADAVQKYVDAIEQHPEHGPLAKQAWYAEPFTLASLEGCASGTLGQAYLRFMVDNDLVERLAMGYRELHEEYQATGKLDAMPEVLQYKVLRGFQTHDLHHVLTGYGATPFQELSLQAFQLAQMDFPYSAMWISVITSHAALVDPHLIQPAMDAITDGWGYGRRAKSLQFVAFEKMLDRPLLEVRAEYGLDLHRSAFVETPEVNTPELLKQAA
jgi:ubiquinone biosynthesis protein COQ4